MPRRRWVPALVTPLVTAVFLAGAAGDAAAQAGDGFLFKRPVMTLGIKGGWHVARAGSDIFDFVQEELTLERGDFDAGVIGVDAAVRISERLDVILAGSMATSTARSEFREWVDQDDLPIEQTTSFHRFPVTLGLKAYLRDRGRSIGRFAWIPATWNAYAGAAGGFVWYEFKQEGDFVDFETFEIFADYLISDGRAPTFHAFGGLEYSLNPSLLFTTEARYAFADVDLEGDFVGFEPIDLSGLQLAAGFSLRF